MLLDNINTINNMNNLKTIQIFACDHRKIDNWKFPFIRLGTGFNNNASIKDITGESICTKENDILYGEGTAIWWLWKHLADFGKLDYIGFCHYRRFLSITKPNFGIYPITLVDDNMKDNIIEKILSPEQQKLLIQKQNIDGILPMKFYDYTYVKGCTTLSQLMKAESDAKNIMLNMPYQLCEKVFEFLVDATPNEYKDNILKTMTDMNTYHFNVFTLTRKLFELYCNIIFKACELTKQYAQQQNYYKNLNPRWIGYIMERYSSCIFKMFINSGKKFIEVPMLILNKKAEYK